MRINEVIQLQIKSTGHCTARQLKEVLRRAQTTSVFDLRLTVHHQCR